MGHDVICVDNDERKVAALQGGDTLIHEDHLPELLDRHRNTKVRFMTDLAEATRECQAIFIAVGTPQSETGDADLSYVEAVACEIARSITDYRVIVEKSTVPVYTNEWVEKINVAQKKRFLANLRLSRSSEHMPVNLGNPVEWTILECAEEVTGYRRSGRHCLPAAA